MTFLSKVRKTKLRRNGYFEIKEGIVAQGVSVGNSLVAKDAVALFIQDVSLQVGDFFKVTRRKV